MLVSEKEFKGVKFDHRAIKVIQRLHIYGIIMA